MGFITIKLTHHLGEDCFIFSEHLKRYRFGMGIFYPSQSGLTSESWWWFVSRGDFRWEEFGGSILLMFFLLAFPYLEDHPT